MTLKESEEKLKIGDTAPDFTLKGTDNQQYGLQDIKGDKATLIVFMCNHCPYVKPKITELIRIQNEFPDIKVIGINSNESENYPEDSFEKMQETVKSYGINFTYLHDETQKIAKEYGAVCTPDPFLFDENLKLLHHSSIDDTHKDKPATKHLMAEAIAEYLRDGKITQEVVPSMGCSIKWKY